MNTTTIKLGRPRKAPVLHQIRDKKPEAFMLPEAFLAGVACRIESLVEPHGAKLRDITPAIQDNAYKLLRLKQSL